MSGGAYNWAYQKVDNFADEFLLVGDCYAAPPALRERFRQHCRLVANAMRAVEWNDDGDGDTDEVSAILQSLGEGTTMVDFAFVLLEQVLCDGSCAEMAVAVYCIDEVREPAASDLSEFFDSGVDVEYSLVRIVASNICVVDGSSTPFYAKGTVRSVLAAMEKAAKAQTSVAVSQS